MPLTVAPITRSCGFFSTGIDSPVTIDSSMALVPSRTTAVDWNSFARPYPKRISGRHALERHVFFAAILANAPCRLRGQAEQGADRRARSTARPQLENLSQQHERHDHGRRFEVHGNAASSCTKRRRETYPGPSVATTL